MSDEIENPVQFPTVSYNHVRLESLRKHHLLDLSEAGNDPRLWQFRTASTLFQNGGIQAVLADLLNRHQNQTTFACTIVENNSSRAVGCITFKSNRPDFRTVEVTTWLGSDFQGRGYNWESKFLLLRFLFEELNCIRVWFEIDIRNNIALAPMERMGIFKEGVIRNRGILADGSVQSSALYSIIDAEWAGTKKRLLETEIAD